MKATPAAKVLGISELLEQILLGQNVKTLFRLQRVNKCFQAVIADSRALQRKMCLLEDPSIDTLGYIEDFANPLLRGAGTEFDKCEIFLKDPLFTRSTTT